MGSDWNDNETDLYLKAGLHFDVNKAVFGLFFPTLCLFRLNY